VRSIAAQPRSIPAIDRALRPCAGRGSADASAASADTAKEAVVGPRWPVAPNGAGGAKCGLQCEDGRRVLNIAAHAPDCRNHAQVSA
jgi:hypothetical protein